MQYNHITQRLKIYSEADCLPVYLLLREGFQPTEDPWGFNKEAKTK